jgi:hypothetical protein
MSSHAEHAREYSLCSGDDEKDEESGVEKLMCVATARRATNHALRSGCFIARWRGED